MMLTKTYLRRACLAVAVCAVVSIFSLNLSAAAPATAKDLAPFKALAKEALALVAANDMPGAAKKGAEIEKKWDASGLDDKLPAVDKQMDVMLAAIKSGKADKATTEINKYLALLDKAAT